MFTFCYTLLVLWIELMFPWFIMRKKSKDFNKDFNIQPHPVVYFEDVVRNVYCLLFTMII